jgi:hypothetical protein
MLPCLIWECKNRGEIFMAKYFLIFSRCGHFFIENSNSKKLLVNTHKARLSHFFVRKVVYRIVPHYLYNWLFS